MRLINRYLIREIAPYVLMTLVLLTSVIFLHEANRFSELFIVFSRNGLSTGPLVSLILSVMPGILVYTIPISLLIGVLIGLGRLSGDSEITAMRASGISRRHLLPPLVLVGLLGAVAMIYLTMWLAPLSQRTIDDLKEARGDIVFQGLATQIKPRVFEESIPGKVFYIQDIDRHTGLWKNIFIADTSDAEDTEDLTVYTARSGKLTTPLPGEILPEFHLFNAQAHTALNTQERLKVEYQVKDVERLSIIFQSTGAPDTAVDESKLPMLEEMDFSTLASYAPPPQQAADYRAEINKRFALPVTCLIFSVIGLAFGVYNQRAGRSFGLLLGLVLTVLFYVLMLGGEKGARSGAFPVWLGVWGPNILFAAIGLWTTVRQRLPKVVLLGVRLFDLVRRKRPSGEAAAGSSGSSGSLRTALGFPRLVDQLIVSDLARHFLFVVAGLTVIFMVFTIFELVGEIVQNRVPTSVVTAYIFYLTPQIASYMAPLAVLVGVMVTFGLMASGSQIVALKASGQSIYRMAVPVFLLATFLAAGLFAVQNYILPTTNREQENLRQQIRSGKEPPRTVFQTDRQWIFGKENRIFYYRHYDPNTDAFLALSIFDFDPETFQITRRIWASSATWNAAAGAWQLKHGWERTFANARIASADAFRFESLQIAETPDYFKRPVSEADKLGIGDLRREIDELSSSGFDVLDLKIDLQNKIAFPITCLIMVLVGLPFAFSIGKHGALFGVAIGLVIGLLFWGALGLFTQMGRYELLPPVLAAWGPNLIFGTGGAYLFLTART